MGVARNVSPLLSGITFDDYGVNVAAGLVPGRQSVIRFGNNPDIDTGSIPEDIWDGPGMYTGQPDHSAGAETIEIFSDDATDDVGNTGATSIRVEGLDENWELQVETFSLDGLTPVVSASLWRRIWTATILTAGSNGANAGTITIRNTTTTGNVFIAIRPGDNQSHNAVYTVPDGFVLVGKDLSSSISLVNGADGSAGLGVLIRPEGSVYQAVIRKQITTGFESREQLFTGFVLPARTDILIRIFDVSANNTEAATRFEGVLVAT